MVAPIKVINIDDCDIDRHICKRIINRSLVCQMIGNFPLATEALDWLKAEQRDVDLIFLDLNMPFMNGFEFLDHFRTLPYPNTVVKCMLTTSRELENIEKARSLGAGYLAKPLTAAAFEQVIEECIKA